MNKMDKLGYEKVIAEIQQIVGAMTIEEAAKVVADLIIDKAQVESEAKDLAQGIFPFKKVGIGEEFRIKTVKGRAIHVHAPGTPAQIMKPMAEFATIPTNRHSYLVSLDINDLQSGRYDEIVEDSKNIRDFFSMVRNALIFSTLYNGADGTKKTGISDAAGFKAALDEILEYQADVPGEGLYIVGRAKQVRRICGFTGFSNEGLRGIELKGYVGNYRGATILEFKNFTDERGTSFVPDKQVIIFNKSCARGVRRRNLEKMMGVNIELPGYDIHTFEELGFAVTHDDRISTITMA